MQLCDAHGLPLVSLIDTPGFMVGPEIESRGQVRHVSRMFVVAAHLRVPVVAVVLRKAYGLGAMAMAAGGLQAPMATVGLAERRVRRDGPRRRRRARLPQGAPRRGRRDRREALRARLVAEQYEKGKAINMAATLEIDAVIDPAETRRWVVAALGQRARRAPGGRFIDPW